MQKNDLASAVDLTQDSPAITTTSVSTCIAPKNSTTATKKFRLQGKRLFLTYPQCSLSKEDALKHLLSLSFMEIKGAIVAQESHADGHKHLHIALFLEERLCVRDPRKLDLEQSSHGNYQILKSVKGTLKYLQKEDKEALIYGELPTFSKEDRELKSTKVAKMILGGSSLDEVNEKDPGYFLLNKRKVEEYQSWVTSKKRKELLRKCQFPFQYTGPDLATQDIVGWLNTNLFCVRPFKSMQLFLSGPANCLKTSLVLSLEKYLMIYHMPLVEDFLDGYNDEDYDLVVLDEFKGQKTIYFLNEWLQGSTMTFRKKGSQGVKRKNIAMIIISNYVLSDIYKDQFKVGLLQTRLKEVYLHNPIDLDNIKFE